jgi:dienelactone hydrolase
VADARSRYPVLVFAPGYGEIPLDYSSLIEDIASHGYIVAAVVPTYFSRETVFSDGRVIRQRELTTVPGISRDPGTAIADAVRMWSRDLSFTLSQLAAVNAGARRFLKGHFDLDHVGAFGHSLGGAAAAQFAHDDARVHAVVSIDGSPFWNSGNHALDKPLLILSAATDAGVTYDRLLAGARPALQLRLAGSGHTFSNDFRLIPGLERASRLTSAAATFDGSIDPVRAHVVAKAYIEAFFGQYLNGKTSALLNGPSRDYPEISFER